METNYLASAIKQFEYYKLLGEKAMQQLGDEQLFAVPSAESNSIPVIVQHLSGNMVSRWTDLLTSDGEKEWRKRDEEFEKVIKSRAELMKVWDKGWDVLFATLKSLSNDDLGKIIYIRNQGCTAQDAINRQLAHYPYHVGQMVFLAKLLVSKQWQSLSIPKNQSKEYNSDKFSKDKSIQHFTDEILKKDKKDDK
ncbi:MAG: DUF1572 family protein [Sphingobacteriaceae bacterium]|nr:DUF1572 family protein [Sphingobacteriaceae bacterium]